MEWQRCHPLSASPFLFWPAHSKAIMDNITVCTAKRKNMQKSLLTKGKWLFLNNLINIALTFLPAAVSLTSEVLDRAEANLHCSGSHFLIKFTEMCRSDHQTVIICEAPCRTKMKFNYESVYTTIYVYVTYIINRKPVFCHRLVYRFLRLDL